MNLKISRTNPIFTKSFLLTHLLIFLTISSLVAADWKQEKNEAGIQVHTREKAGSDLKEFRGMMWVNGVTLSQLIAVINDVTSYPSWYGSTSEARVLKKNGDTHLFLYIRNKAPWPVSDRDMVIECKITQDAATKAVTISIAGSQHSHPVVSGVVRMTRVTGFWRFTPQKNGAIAIYYQLHNDPGGSLPAFVANKAVVDMPFKTLNNLRSRVALAQYKNAKFSFITD